MLPLHAIPTEVIRKGFRPYRGFYTKIGLDLPEEEARVYERESADALEKIATLSIDCTPLYQIFSQLFGYELNLLQVGNGDCGVDGHDWNLYGSADGIPKVIRWRGFGGGEALLCLGKTGRDQKLVFVGLADRQMAGKMAEVFGAIAELGEAPKSPRHEQAPANILAESQEESFGDWGVFSSSFCCFTDHGEPTAQQLEEVRQLRFSCSLEEGYPIGLNNQMRLSYEQHLQLRKSLVPGQRIVLIGKVCLPAVLQPEEPLPTFLQEQIYASSVTDVERAMQEILAKALRGDDEGAVERFLYNQAQAIAGNLAECERAAALARIETSANRPSGLPGAWSEVTFGPAFRMTSVKDLLGTQSSRVIDDNGDVVTITTDMLEMLVTCVTSKAAEQFGRKVRKPFWLRGHLEAKEGMEPHLRPRPCEPQPRKLRKPYTTLYRGLPIRVTDSYEVPHPNGAEGLACDYYVDQQKQAVHFVSLYRVKGGG